MGGRAVRAVFIFGELTNISDYRQRRATIMASARRWEARASCPILFPGSLCRKIAGFSFFQLGHATIQRFDLGFQVRGFPFSVDELFQRVIQAGHAREHDPGDAECNAPRLVGERFVEQAKEYHH
jgi:hypothetical protein